MTNNDDTPTTPLDDARDPGPAPEPSTRPASENPAPKRSVARPLLIGAAAGVGVLLLGGLGALAVDALTDGRDVETVPAAEVGPDGSGQTTGDADASRPDDGGQSDDAVGPNQTPGSPLAERGEPAALVEAIDRAVAAADGTGASAVEVEGRGWSVDVILADGTEVDVRVAVDGATTVRADNRDDDADPALDTSRIADIADAAIAATGGTGVVSSIETDRDDDHEFSVSVWTVGDMMSDHDDDDGHHGGHHEVEVDLSASLEVVDIDD